jgi:hypothetical protein
LELCTYYRWFITGFTNIVNPLTKPRRISLPVDSRSGGLFSNTEGSSLYLICAYLQPGERFVVDTDVSSVGIGGVLPQIQDRQERVIAYYRKTLNNA